MKEETKVLVGACDLCGQERALRELHKSGNDVHVADICKPQKFGTREVQFPAFVACSECCSLVTARHRRNDSK